MHIPENYLSPSTCAVMAAAMVPVWTYSVKKVKEEIPKVKMPLLGIGAAFSFLGMMFNIPLPGGTTGHAVGGTLIAILTGSPSAGCIAVTIALLIQALLFGDGGILAFGANCFNMAFILPFLGFAIYKLIWEKTGKRKLAAGIGSYIGINAAAFCAAIEFGIQPLLFTDAAGKALYCPYPLTISIPAMMIGHLTLFGIAEVVSEKMIDTVIGVSGSSPAYVFMFIEAMADAAVADGMPRAQAYEFAAQAVMGSAKMVLETGKHPGELKDMVCSPGGTTIEAVRQLEKGGFRSSIIEAMKACVEVGRKM